MTLPIRWLEVVVDAIGNPFRPTASLCVDRGFSEPNPRIERGRAAGAREEPIRDHEPLATGALRRRYGSEFPQYE